MSKSLVFHIATQRFEHIRSQSWKFPPLLTASDEQIASLLRSGDNSYHFLGKDTDFCAICGVAVRGMLANNPAELEAAKLRSQSPEMAVIDAAIAWRGCSEKDSARLLAALTVEVDNLSEAAP